MKRWAQRFDECAKCHLSDEPHEGGGLCERCYNRLRTKRAVQRGYYRKRYAGMKGTPRYERHLEQQNRYKRKIAAAGTLVYRQKLFRRNLSRRIRHFLQAPRALPGCLPVTCECCGLQMLSPLKPGRLLPLELKIFLRIVKEFHKERPPS